MNATSKLIECGDHSFAPWAATCVHICEGTATEVVPIPQPDGSEVENDWLCPQCVQRYFIGLDCDVEDLRMVCIHCLRKLLKPYQKQGAKI